MYHIYEVVLRNMGFKCHMYAECFDEVSKMFDGLNHNATKECRDFAESINYKMIADELKSYDADHDEDNIKRKMEKFFSRYYKPYIKQCGAIGGYVLEYKGCSISSKAKMSYQLMLNYLDEIWENPFFKPTQIIRVVADSSEGAEICIPSYNTRFGVVAKLEFGHRDEVTEDKLRVAGKALGFIVEYRGEKKDTDVYLLEFTNIQQFCQFLNNFPLVYIDDILCL